MKLRRPTVRLSPLLLSAALVSSPCSAAPAGLPPLTNLAPGSDLRIQQTADVNVVLVGFGGIVDPAAAEAAVSSLVPWNGVPQADASGQSFLGQRFDFRYHFTLAPTWFEDAFFTWLHAAAQPQAPLPFANGMLPLPITPGQFVYDFCNLDPTYDPAHGCSFNPDAPRVNRRFVTQNYLLNATSVEKVLSQALPSALGIDVTRPTIVLLNWWGRPDYVDHIYLDPSEPDPETHAPRGLFVANELAGYGGTSVSDPETCAAGDCVHHRLWFYDVSAGPMVRTGGFDLVADVPRMTGALNKGAPDYRFHHIADYGTPSGTYRPLDTLLFDLDLLVGEVFVSEIAFGAPLYPPGLTPPQQPHRISLDINRWSWSGQSLGGLLDVPRVIAKMDALPYDFAATVTDQSDGPDSNIGRIWQCSMTSEYAAQLGQSCYGNRNGGYAFGDLQSYFSDHLFQYLTGAPDYEVPIFQFDVPPGLAQNGFTGVADSNYDGFGLTPTALADLRQSFVFTSTTPSDDATNGHGALLEHETGHHLGFSHPHNGYRCFNDACGPYVVAYGVIPETFFSWAGDYVTGLMTYANVNNDYSRFELDGVQRWLTWQYLDLSNFVASRIGASPRAGAVSPAVSQADALAGAALGAYQAYDYASAVQQARAAYDALMAAADAINVHISPQDYHSIRRNPADTNQALRDAVQLAYGDRTDEMKGGLSADGVPGLEGITFAPPTTKFAESLPEAKSLTLKY
jgi:hypothetical protein